MADLLHRKVAVIVAVNTPAAKAAQSATKTVPIVIIRVADPVKAGLVRSLGHPGANVTGVSFMPDVLGAKAVEALCQTIPTVSRVAAFYKADNPGALLVVTETERRSAELGVRFEHLPIHDPSELPDSLAAAARAGVQAAFVMDDGAMTKLRGPFLKLASRRSLPVVSIYKDFAEAGGLFCVRARSRPRLPARGPLRGAYPQGREPRRAARGAGGHVPLRHQPEDGQDARADDPVPPSSCERIA